MVSTGKKRQSIRRLLSQLDDFDQDVNIGNAMSCNVLQLKAPIATVNLKSVTLRSEKVL